MRGFIGDHHRPTLDHELYRNPKPKPALLRIQPSQMAQQACFATQFRI